MRFRWLAGALSVAIVAVLGVAQLLASSATAQSQAPTQRVIVVLKNQDRAQPARNAPMVTQRSQTVHSLQAPIVSQLTATHATNVHQYTVLNAVSATVTPAEESSLKSNPAVKEVVPDGYVHLAPTSSGNTGSGSSSSGGSGGTTPPAGACAPNGQVQLNPEALETISANSDVPGAKTAASLGITGKGVKVGFIADGLNTHDPDFVRGNGQPVFVDYKDFSGFGTAAPTFGGESFGDASSIAAQGRLVYDVSHWSALPLNRPCKIRIEGVAPGASLVGLVAFGASNVAPDSSILEAIDYAVDVDHVNVLNESFGINNYPDDGGAEDLIAQANDQAVAAGISVVESTGDAGPTNTIGEAATDPNVISAGASTTYRLFVQAGYGGARFPGVTGWLDNDISSLSSSGFDQRGRTLDLVAPGDENWALCTANTHRWADCTNLKGQPSNFEQFGGTSESSPLTAGVAALVIQAYEKTHQGTLPSPALVKQLIVSNTDDIGSPAEEQGSGLVDAYKAVLAAENYNQPKSGGSTQGQGVGVLANSATQLNAIDAPSSPESLSDTVTNESGSTQHLTFTGRTLGASTSVASTTVDLSDSGPQTEDYTGATDDYQKVTFQVPAGENRLSASAAFNNAPLVSLSARVRITLIDPNGKFAAYSLPQGDGSYGNVQVTNPASGTWTAYIWGHDSAFGGYTGPVVFGATVAKYTSFGTVTPSSATLAPGQAVAVTDQTSTPAQPGDVAGAIVEQASPTGGGGTSTSTTIPITLRSLIMPGNQSFTGTLTGGNGRAPISGEEFYYQLDLPAGQPELNATVSEPDPNSQFGAYLIDPQGEAVAYATNMLPGTGGSSTPTNVAGAQLHTLNPPAGRWTVIVVFAPAVSGTALSEPFQVTTSQQPVPASAGGLPDNKSAQLTAGQTYTYDVTVKNTGPAPELFFPDARLNGSAPFTLLPVSGASTVLPQSTNIPVYLVPTDSTQFDAQTSTSGQTPVQFESQYVGGDPDLESTTGNPAYLTVSDSPIAQGEWDVLPIESGTFGSKGPGSETATTSASVVTSPFDTTFDSSTGDLEADSANPASSLSSFSPISVAPGQTATIPVTVTPTGQSGTQVQGTLYLDDTAYFEFGSIQNAVVNFPQADQVAALPYHYTIK